MNKILTRFNPRLLTALLASLSAAALFTTSLKYPLWHLKMEAPQYQGSEALRVRVYAGSLQGDLREIGVLNKYIGVSIPERLPQLRWLSPALLSASGLGLLALFLPGAVRSRFLFGVAALMGVVLLYSAGLAQWQMHCIGHERNPHAALTGVHNFTPPLLGRVKVANFEITTGLGTGAFLITFGLALQIGAGKFCAPKRRCSMKAAPKPGISHSCRELQVGPAQPELCALPAREHSSTI